MSRIEVDSPIANALEAADAPVVVYNKEGKRLGRFIPEIDPMEDCPYTEEELKQHYLDALANPGDCKPLSQIWKELGRK
jgi:hypothetical protein